MNVLDVHSHRPGAHSVFNVVAFRDAVPEEGWYSLGLHPWHLPDGQIEACLRALEAHWTDVRCLAIGEGGLDALRGPKPEIQMQWFEAQARVAEDLSKPLVVHQVRTFDRIMALHRKRKPHVPWLLHGYRGSWRQAKPWIEQGGWVSLGRTLLNPNSPAQELIQKLPPNRILLETDEACDDFHLIFAAAAHLLDASAEALSLQLNNNAKLFFHGRS
jgi:TatD DNase family protein